ncbi:MAG: putative bifunctional diguanylate cyclase/phosphodiesterase [Acidimicrobiia bacterium]
MNSLSDPRRSHPSARARPPVGDGRRTLPSRAAGASAALVLAATTALLLWRPDLRDASAALTAALGGVVATSLALATWDLTRRGRSMQRSIEEAARLAVEREERLELILGSLHEGLIFQDADLRLREYNDAAARILGLSEQSLGRLPEELGPWEPLQDDGSVLAWEDCPAAVTLRTGEPQVQRSAGIRSPEGTTWLLLSTVPVLGDDGTPEGVITTFHDVTAERSTRDALASTEAAASVAAQALSWQARHDPLTELPNRALLLERLTEALAGAAATERTTAVLSLDLDRFQQVNDTMGHDAGDRVLLETASRLRATLRDTDLVARLSGDEFIVVAGVPDDPQEAVQLAERLRAVLARPIWLPQGNVTLSASVGIAFDAGHGASTLLRDADTALHKAKAHGGDRAEVFDESLRAEAIRRVAAEQILRRALDEDGLRVLYQPIVDLHDGRLVGAEALLRVVGPHQELLTPASFIAIAEETGLIVPLGAGVLDRACAQLAAWQRDLGDRAPQHVSVNLAARQLTGQFPAVVEGALAVHGLRPDQLVLELTETALIEAGQEALDSVNRLHALGVRLAIDDFGTGYSSLAYLKRFPVDIVKIDRSFTRGLGTDQHDTEIVRAVVALARSLDLVCVAEGVETVEQLRHLHRLGCDEAQGYLLARPLPGPDLGGAIDAIDTLTADLEPEPTTPRIRVVGR